MRHTVDDLAIAITRLTAQRDIAFAQRDAALDYLERLVRSLSPSEHSTSERQAMLRGINALLVDAEKKLR